MYKKQPLAANVLVLVFFLHLGMILVTGGSGFLGAHVLVQLSAMDTKIVATKRSTTQLGYVKRVFDLHKVPHQFEKIEWKNVDFFDTYEVEDALEHAEQVYHCASEVSFHPKHHQRMIENNVTITANLANAALYTGVKKFMHVSSIAALGRSAQAEIIDETRIWKTDPVNTKYGLSKYKSEMEVWRAFEEGLPVIVVNPAMIMGYCPWNEGTGKMFDRAFEGMKFYTHGYTGWVDVNDVAACMIQLMQKDINGERYIISGETKGYKEIFELMAEAMGRPKAKKEANLKLAKWMVMAEGIKSKLTGSLPLVTTESLRNATLACDYVNQKIKTELGYTFIPIETTIKQTASIYLAEHKLT
jgi:nucleoside-diphosphate-sugar epimerase